MSEWKTIPAKFTLEEKQFLDKLRDKYELSHNQTIRLGVEFLSRLIAFGDYYVRNDNKTLKKIRDISKKHAKSLESDIKNALKSIPIEEQQADYDKHSSETSNIITLFDNVFDKNRKRGRKSIKRKRGRPIDKGRESKLSPLF